MHYIHLKGIWFVSNEAHTSLLVCLVTNKANVEFNNQHLLCTFSAKQQMKNLFKKNKAFTVLHIIWFNVYFLSFEK